MLPVAIHEDSLAHLPDYEAVSIAFLVERVFDLASPAPGSHLPQLVERALRAPYVKNYDDVDEDRPTRWARRFDLTNWGLLAARVDGRRVGGAAIAWKTPGLEMLEGRDDLAVLWDFRIAPGHRGHGVGSALFAAVNAWAAARGCGELKVETQNVNVPACRFYASRGCELAVARPHAYPDLPHEVQLIWRKAL